jgi:transposase
VRIEHDTPDHAGQVRRRGGPHPGPDGDHALQLRLIDAMDFEIDIVTRLTTANLAHHPGFRAIQAIDGVGPVLATVFIAEIGGVTRFPGPEQMCSWAGLTPRHRESDTKVHRGRITKQGNNLLRWAAVEAVQPGWGSTSAMASPAPTPDTPTVGERRPPHTSRPTCKPSRPP